MKPRPSLTKSERPDRRDKVKTETSKYVYLRPSAQLARYNAACSAVCSFKSSITEDVNGDGEEERMERRTETAAIERRRRRQSRYKNSSSL